MSTVLGSLKSRWKGYISGINDEFYGHVGELLENDKVMRLDSFTHHHGVTRLRHSLDVAYSSFFISKLLRWDSRSIARAGLLHDLFFYDWRDDDYVKRGRGHAFDHPEVSLQNAREICKLNKIEEDIIRRHMWLVTLTPPRYKEGYIVTLVDKICAVRELALSIIYPSRPPRSVTAKL
ncbi:MAG: hydrolase [Oscillospiraceae bacterium]|nr:hydrolase [Oscillospiraceae bacterium]